MKKPSSRLTDAQAMHRRHPDSFEVPSKQELDKLKRGSFVKINACAERFWVKVTSVKGKKVCGVVDNETGCPKYAYKKKVCFQKKHIYDIG